MKSHGMGCLGVYLLPLLSMTACHTTPVSLEEASPTPSSRLLAFQDADRAAELANNAASDIRFMKIADAIVQLAQSKNRHNASGDIEDEAGKNEYLEASRALDAGELDKALESIIEVLKVNRYLDDDGARKMGIAVFSLLGQDHALTRKYRRTFDMWLY